MNTSLLCRPCREAYSPAELQGRRACPKCKGPLVSQQQLETYQANTQTKLAHLKKRSASTLTVGIILAMGIQTLLNLMKHNDDFRMLTTLVFTGGIASWVATSFWRNTGKPGWMLAASVLFQGTTFIYAFSVFAASVPLLEIATDDSTSKRVSEFIIFFLMTVAFSPLGLALLAWHQYASFMRIVKS